ncbi:hypothetical protein [Weissella cibaria]|uniref:hypothetical protein n=1 Tax=Weissella cibaria TaxID=137591 RepID=UPI002A74EB78|nr:hypothetical protein [Weissella cibaria]MDY2520490.1 hypothetical protein [Weissella cibaria]
MDDFKLSDITNKDLISGATASALELIPGFAAIKTFLNATESSIRERKLQKLLTELDKRLNEAEATLNQIETKSEEAVIVFSTLLSDGQLPKNSNKTEHYVTSLKNVILSDDDSDWDKVDYFTFVLNNVPAPVLEMMKLKSGRLDSDDWYDLNDKISEFSDAAIQVLVSYGLMETTIESGTALNNQKTNIKTDYAVTQLGHDFIEFAFDLPAGWEGW